MPLDLAVVMPVYNEEACIADVVKSWEKLLSGLGISFRMIVLNDGSRDRTKDVLAAFSGSDHIEVMNKENSGHGPTILVGYHEAVKLAPWVFQTDSDGEMGAEHFPLLWSSRENYDALFGVRAGRQQNCGRKLISAVSRATVRLVFGAGIADVNTPYRLMRADLLKQIIDHIPDDTFAPNVIISGAFAKAGTRIYNYPVPHEPRRTGTVSIVKWKLWRSAIKSFVQTVHCRPSIIVGSRKTPGKP